MLRRTQKRTDARQLPSRARSGPAGGLIAGAIAGCALFALSADAQAAEKNEPLTIETDTSLDIPEFAPVRGLEPRFARDLTWTRLALDGGFGPAPAGSTAESLRPPSLLQGLDLRQGIWTNAPGAGAGVATAATSLMTSGLSMFKVLRDGKLRQRHTMRCFFRSNGIKLAWRIEF